MVSLLSNPTADMDRLPLTCLLQVYMLETKLRSGEVIINWEPVWMTIDDDRGYLIEAYLCQRNMITWHAYHTDSTTITLIDEPGCSEPSSALLYVVEKHGYTDPVTVPWP